MKIYSVFIFMIICISSLGQGRMMQQSISKEEPFGLNLLVDSAGEYIAVQVKGLNRETMNLFLIDAKEMLVQQAVIYPGSTIAYFDTRTLYDGEYLVRAERGEDVVDRKIRIGKTIK